MAVWVQSVDSPSYDDVVASRWQPGVGWGIPVLLHSDDTLIQKLAMTMTADGDAFVAWTPFNDTRHELWVARYRADTGWEPAIQLSAVGHPGTPTVSANAVGEAIVGWVAAPASQLTLEVATYQPGVGWSSVEPVTTLSTFSQLATPALDDGGVAHLVWTDGTFSESDVWSTRNSGSGWEAPIRLEAAAGFSGLCAADVDRLGNVFAAWLQMSGGVREIWTASYTPGVGWATAGRVYTMTLGGPSTIDVAAGRPGQAVVVWDDYGSGESHLVESRFAAGSGWSAAIRLTETGPGGVSAPSAAADQLGNTVIVWNQPDGPTVGLWSSRSLASGQWDTPLVLDVANSDVLAYSGQIDVNASGSAAAVWIQDSGVWARLFE